MDTVKKNMTAVGIEIYQAIPISFQVSPEYEFEDELNIKNLNIMMDSEFGIDNDASKIGVKVTLNVSSIIDKIQLFELVAFFEFGVFDLKDVTVKKKGKERLESEFARKLLNISIGGARGMLVIYLASTPYKDFTLPIANIPDEIFKFSCT